MLDESTIPFLMFMVVLIVAAIGFYYSYRRNQERRDALFALSYRLGMTFEIEDTIAVCAIYNGFDCLSKGYDEKAFNVMSGRVGRYLSHAFDYQYTTGGGKDRQTHRMSAVVFDTDVSFPSLTIRPEGIFDRLAGAVGFNDIDFESEEFSRKFYVKSKNKQFAYGVIHPKMMEYLLADTQWDLQMLGRSVIVCNHRVLAPDEFMRAMTFLERFLDLLPDYLLQQLHGS